MNKPINYFLLLQYQCLFEQKMDVQKGRKAFQCENCDYSSDDKSKLVRHVSSVHKGKKPYLCDKCDNKFSEISDLKRHISSVHEEKKPYKCDRCESRFGHVSHLYRHKSSVHGGIRYKCVIQGVSTRYVTL